MLLEDLIREREFWFEYGLKFPHLAQSSERIIKHLDQMIAENNTEFKYFLVSDEHGNSVDWIPSDNWG